MQGVLDCSRQRNGPPGTRVGLAKIDTVAIKWKIVLAEALSHHVNAEKVPTVLLAGVHCLKALHHNLRLNLA